MYRNLLIVFGGLASLLVLFLISFNGSARGRADHSFVNGAEPETLDVCFMTGQPEGAIADCIFDGLTAYHPETLEPVPAVATSWELDGLTITFHLRPDHWWVKQGEIVTTPAGEKRSVTAHDFVYSWKRHCLPEVGSQYSFLLDSIEGIEQFKADSAEQWRKIVADVESAGGVPPQRPEELTDDLRREVETFRERLWAEIVGIRAVDERTLEVKLKAFIPYFLQVTSFYPLYPVPREAVEKYRDQWTLPANIVTNGAYMLDTWRFNSFIRLRKNPHYFETEAFARQRLDDLTSQDKLNRTEELEKTLLESFGSFEKRGFETIDALALEKEDTAFNMYQDGMVDRIRSLPIHLVGELLDANEQQPIPDLHHSLNPTLYYYDINMQLPIFARPVVGKKIRKALALAIDRERLIREVTRAHQLPARSMVADFVRGYESQPRFGTGDFEKDVAVARQLIAEVKEAGVTLPELRILYNTLEGHKTVAAFVQDQWKRNLGLNANLENQEWQVYLNSRRSGQFDLARAGWIPDYSDPNTFLELFTSDDFESDRDPSRLTRPIVYNQQNHPHYNNPHYNRLVLRYAVRTRENIATKEGRQSLLEDVRSWPGFEGAIGGVIRKNGTTSIADLEQALKQYDAAGDEEERLASMVRARYLLLEMAEQMLMDDMPVIPIYHYTMTQVWPPELDGIWMNERDSHPARFLRWKDDVRPVGSRYDDFPRLWPRLAERPAAKK